MAILALVLLVLLSGFLSLSEFAVVSSRRMRLEQSAQRGHRGARMALLLLNSPTRFLSTVQIGNTLCAIIAGAVGQAALTETLAALLGRIPALQERAFEISTVIVVAVITYIWLVFGELVPKRLALNNPEKTAGVIAPPMRLLSIITAPAVSLLSATIEVVLKLFPAKTPGLEMATEDEIRGLIAQATRAGTFLEKERELVERIFQLGDQRVNALMVPRGDIVWLPADAATERVRLAVATSSHSHFPVCDPAAGLEKIIGVVHLKDLIQAGLLTKQIDLKILARKPLFVPETTPVLRLLDDLRKGQTHLAFVLDEYGVIAGLITLNDIVGSMLGPIARYGETIEPLAVMRDDGSWLLDGSLPVYDLKGLMQTTTLPHEERTSFQTVGGFVMTYLGRVPRTGEWFAFDRYRFEVVDMDRHRVDKVLLSFAKPEERQRPR